MNSEARNSAMRPTHTPAPRDRDFYRWATETAQAIRERSFTAVDWEAVAEELDDMGRSEQRELESRLCVLLSHLLKWQHRPEPPPEKSWALTIKEQRRRTRRLLKQSPGLKHSLEGTFAEAYGDARLQAARDCGSDENAFPETCPWTFEQTLDEGYWPGKM
jgi:hypothetical protein